MERLITWTQHGPKIKGFYMAEHDFDLTECRILGDVASRLAAYEDSGLSPEEVQALSTTPADYHNPADVEALRKAREAIQRAKENFEPYGEYEYDVRYDLEEALAEIDKAIGGKEDV